MDSSIHLHFSSKINSLEFSEDDLGRYKIPLLSRQSLSRKGLGVAVVKLDKFIESFLISNYINNGRSDIQMSGNIEQSGTDLRNLRTQQISDYWDFCNIYDYLFSVWDVLMKFPDRDKSLNQNENFTSLMVSLGIQYFGYRIPTVGKGISETDRETENNFITFLLNFTYDFVSEKLPERDINQFQFNKLLLSLISMDVEISSNNPIDVKAYRITFDNFLSNLDQPNAQRNALSVLSGNFATNINIINSILSYIKEFIDSRYNFVHRNDGYSDEIFILLKRLFSQTKYNNLSSEQENYYVKPVVLCFHSILIAVKTTVQWTVILT